MKIKTILILLEVLFSLTCYTQNNENDDSYKERIFDNLLETDPESFSSEDYDFSSINDIYINIIKDEDIQNIIFLNSQQKEQLIIYRQKYGVIYSISEIRLIDCFDESTCDILAQYLNFRTINKNKYTFKDIFKEGKYEIISRLSATYNYNSETMLYNDTLRGYAGGRAKLLNKFLYNFNDVIRASIIIEKDAGETLIDKIHNNFEHISGFIQYKNKNYSILLGDYYIQFGQGLGVWNGQSFISGTDEVSKIKYSNKIKPKTSAEESLFFRGFAASVDTKQLSFYTYCSYKSFDSNIDSTENGTIFSSLRTDGYHRTANEIKKKQNLPALNTGIGINYKLQYIRCMASVNYLKFQYQYYPKSNIENSFKQRGKEYYTYTFDFISNIKKSVIYGEIAMIQNYSNALTLGWDLYSSPLLNIGLNFRHLSPKFTNFFNNNTFKFKNGENGISIKYVAYIGSHTCVISSVDIANPLWYSSTISILSPAIKVNTKIKYDITKYATTYLYYVYSPDTDLHNMRINLELYPRDKIKIHIRAEFTKNKENNGNLLYHEIVYKHKKLFSLTNRVSCFDIDNYNVKIYSYENDVLYNYSNKVYYGKGISDFLLVNIKILRNISIWAKATHIWYYNRKEANAFTYTIESIIKI